jgi:Flp pilus assembly protein TadD/nitrate/TMAO reductase-like tetraheme cytochrome c subunit
MSKKILFIVPVAVLLAAVVALVWQSIRPPAVDSAIPAQTSAAKPASAAYVGGASCAACHAEQFEQWQGSHHDLAMQEANAQSVLGDFNNAEFQYYDVSSRFYRDGERFMVRTDGPDGSLQDYPIKYTFGVTPLQQYLIEFPNGRLQALGIAWDSRPAEAGGQRWFHLYPDENIDHNDELHWTGHNQNWNFMCADCHSTNLQKNYDAGSQHFDTRWSEINVSCEACHGPGSVHNTWAAKDAAAQALDKTRGLVVSLDERRGVSWQMDSVTGTAQRSTPRDSTTEIQVCAQCHARRAAIASDYVPGHAFMDAYRPALLTERLYYPDGQIKDEVYVYGSFIQSKMHHAGVTCSDCHEAHSLNLRAPDDQVCLGCHAADRFASEKHHFHKPESKGARCAECHMPETNYMVVDPRRDHSIRVPRPDLSDSLGTPNACIRCHADQTNSWAAERVREWYGEPVTGYQDFAGTLHAARNGAPHGAAQLLDLIGREEQPAIARATALSLLASYQMPQAIQSISDSLYDDDPIVRLGGLDALDSLQPGMRFTIGQHLLEDEIRTVRIETGRVLADTPADSLDAGQRARLKKAVDEYIAAQRLNADQPQTHINLGNLYLRMGAAGEAELAYRQALILDEAYVPAYINLADLFRATGREQAALNTLRQGLAVAPGYADLHYVYGLALVRSKQLPGAVEALARAAELHADNARYTYVYAVALDANGETGKAVEVLERYQENAENNVEILSALASYTRKSGDVAKADQYEQQLTELQGTQTD